MNPHHGSMTELSAEYDAIADLFLAEPAGLEVGPRLRLAGESPAETAPAAPAVREAVPIRVEGLLMGHLPVLGGAWVTQYAKHVADQAHQPVALVRVQAGTLSVDLVLPRGSSGKVNSRIGAGAQGEDLSHALASAASEASLWLVRVDEIHEPELLAMAHLHRVTLLTGADDAAVVASYRTIKNLISALEARETETGPTLGLAIMGAGEEDAGEAEQKIRKAVQTFLGTELKPAARVGRVGACSTQTLYRAASSLSIGALLEHVTQASKAASQLMEPKPTPAGATPAMGSEAARAPLQVAPNTPPVTPTAHAKPTPTQHGRGAELLGLRGLATICPYAPGVCLASGEGGKLHLVIAASGAGGDCSLDEGVRRLLTAAAWADDHAGLLESAHADALAGVRATGPTLHLLTPDARSARGLLDTGVKVHLVASAVVQGQTATVTHALN